MEKVKLKVPRDGTKFSSSNAMSSTTENVWSQSEILRFKFE